MAMLSHWYIVEFSFCYLEIGFFFWKKFDLILFYNHVKDLHGSKARSLKQVVLLGFRGE